jgi:anti-sigma28 factor (negative regulator of flagellin synthesis)
MDVEKVSDSVHLTEALTEHLKAVKGQKPKGKASPNAAKADTAAGSDSLAISGEAKEKAKIARYVRIVKEAPDVRPDKVAEAKRKLAAGEYDRSEVAEEIARRMLQE